MCKNSLKTFPFTAIIEIDKTGGIYMNVVIKVSDETKAKMMDYYKDKKRDKVIPYAIFQAEEEDTVITMYESGKVMFQERVPMSMQICGNP